MIHRLKGLTKLICFLILTSAVMYTFDLRLITSILLFSFIVMRLAKIEFRSVRVLFLYALGFLVVNEIMTFLFAPLEGVNMYGTYHELFRFSERYPVTIEQLFYQLTKFTKYISVIPLGMIFLFTTNPSELAASLNRLGVNYKVAYAVALTLRYFPDVQRAYVDISLAQQARGVDLSRKARLGERVGSALAILIPLIFSTLERVERISNAMDLRGFGKYKKRSWYAFSPLEKHDYVAIGICVLILVVIVLFSITYNGGRVYNPFKAN